MNINNQVPDHILEIINRHLDYVVPVANRGGLMAAGVNGPYYDVETPVRNTAHWLITFALLFKSTGEEQYKHAANKLLNFLLNPGKHCKEQVYVHRQKKGKDWSNGIIGQAWVVEALNIAGKILNSTDASKKAVEAVNVFKFNNSLSVWDRIDAADGSKAIDYTLNHQLWFAAAKAETDHSSYVEVDTFLTSLQNGAFRVRSNGLICHLLYSSSFKGKLLEYRYLLLEKKNMKAVLVKEIGYHLFNLYPLARLYRVRSEHPFFKTEKFIKALNYMVSEEFIEALENNKYAYPYNSPAFEMPLALFTFKHLLKESIDIDDIIKRQLQKQEELTFDSESKVFSKNTDDSLTLTARLYEYILGLEYKSH